MQLKKYVELVVVNDDFVLSASIIDWFIHSYQTIDY